MRYAGIDFGTRRIGLAFSDETGTLAFPHSVVRAGPHALSQIADLLTREGVGAVVLGESRNFAGEANPVMEQIDEFKKDLEELTGLAVAYEPEFMTSASAARQFAPDGSRGKAPSQAALDASAAAVILQSFLDRNGKKQ